MSSRAWLILGLLAAGCDSGTAGPAAQQGGDGGARSLDAESPPRLDGYAPPPTDLDAAGPTDGEPPAPDAAADARPPGDAGADDAGMNDAGMNDAGMNDARPPRPDLGPAPGPATRTALCGGCGVARSADHVLVGLVGPVGIAGTEATSARFRLKSGLVYLLPEQDR